jgi:hypothetical protein
MMRLLLLLGVCLMGPWAASAQQLWGTLPLPGAAPAARVVADLGGNAGRIDEFLLVDFAHRHYGTATRSQGPETFGRYLTFARRAHDHRRGMAGWFCAAGAQRAA